MSSGKEDIISKWWFMNRKKRRAHLVHPHIKRNFNHRVHCCQGITTGRQKIPIILSNEQRKFR
jgi:hypothetical protein